MAHEELKQRQSVMWGTGPYQRITETIADIHELVIDRLDPQPGERWLDLACGTGAVAERAAARGRARDRGRPRAGADRDREGAGVGARARDRLPASATASGSTSRTRASTSSPRRAGSCSRPTTRRRPASSPA